MSKAKFVVESRFWLRSGEQSLCGRGRIELLERIGETGSIRQAALAMGMSYRAAWDAVDAMNQRAGKTLIARKTGGARGGGAELSEDGRRLIALYRKVEREHARLVESLNRKIAALTL
ncbi:MAG: LysR family transcriptional regulator [Solimonas sp.]